MHTANLSTLVGFGTGSA